MGSTVGVSDDAEARGEGRVSVRALHELRQAGPPHVQVGARAAGILLRQVRHLRVAGPLFVAVQRSIQSPDGPQWRERFGARFIETGSVLHLREIRECLSAG